MNQTIHHPKDLDRYYQNSLESLFPESKINAFKMLSADNRRLIDDLKHSGQIQDTRREDTQSDEN